MYTGVSTFPACRWRALVLVLFSCWDNHSFLSSHAFQGQNQNPQQYKLSSIGASFLHIGKIAPFPNQSSDNARVSSGGERPSSLSLDAVPRRPGGGGMPGRESEIRRKIAQLKREGRIKKGGGKGEVSSEIDSDDDDDGEYDVMIEGQRNRPSPSSDYESKIRKKLGTAKSKMLGYGVEGSDEDEDEDGMMSSNDLEVEEANTPSVRTAQLGSLSSEVEEETVSAPKTIAETGGRSRTPIINPSLFESSGDDDDEEMELSEEELVELVEKKMLEKRAKEMQEKELQMKEQARELLDRLEQERQEQESKRKQQQQQQQVPSSSATSTSGPTKQLTSGVGGSWDGNDESATEDVYQPKTGSWGAFPRPRDISKAYGGGRRVGAGFTSEEEKRQSEEDTRARLQRYREKVGIEVQSEKDNAVIIEEALKIGNAAMQRGMYTTAVSALEKVTRYCSTNSKVGGKVFLELAMAYEAAGQTQEAIAVYSELSKSRMEDIKIAAKRLLYGLEAMQFMRDDLKSKSFSRKKIRNTFIDATGLANIASNFDDVYQTAYVDLEGNTYKRLTESVVRTTREARQVLLRATDSGEVTRLKVVQALRSISRKFDDALMTEIQPPKEPVAFLNGKPLIVKNSQQNTLPFGAVPGDEFILPDAKSMKENLDGEWRLQLLADKRGDGVKYFNSTLSWQSVDIGSMTFSSAGPAGFVTVQQSGKLDFNSKKRILRRTSISMNGAGGVFTTLFSGGSQAKGAIGAVSSPQQVMSVDSVLLITRGVPNKLARQADDEKDYFAVWRRVEPGTFSSKAAKSSSKTTPTI